jgi:hypothetical protein
MRRPFPIRYLISQTSDLLEARIRFKHDIDPVNARILEAGKEKFKDLANAGALCGETIEPDQSWIGSARAAISGSDAKWTFSSVRVDPFSLTVLVNMIHVIHDKYIPVSELDVSWGAISEGTDPSKVQFPEAYRRPPFAFTYDDTLSSFDIVLDFVAPQELEHVEEMEGIVGMWFSAANFGAYGDEASPPSINQIFFEPEVSTVNDEGIAWHIERFACTSHAIDGLVNIVAKLDRTHARIQSLAITE